MARVKQADLQAGACVDWTAVQSIVDDFTADDFDWKAEASTVDVTGIPTAGKDPVGNYGDDTRTAAVKALAKAGFEMPDGFTLRRKRGTITPAEDGQTQTVQMHFYVGEPVKR